MRGSTYNRPFERAVATVRSRGSGGRQLPNRIRQLRRGHSRGLLWAAVLSVVVHGLVGYGLRDHRSSFVPPKSIGYRGPTRILDITPESESQDRRDLVVEQYRASALEAIEIVVETEPLRPEPVVEESFETPADSPTVATETPPTVPREIPNEALIFQLKEDWTVDPASPQAALSDLLHPLHIVVPEYPELALMNEVQGRVLLEAEVGISGRILDIQVVEASDGALTMAASRALLLWQFEPLVVNGRAHRFRILIPFRFRIEGHGSGPGK